MIRQPRRPTVHIRHPSLSAMNYERYSDLTPTPRILHLLLPFYRFSWKAAAVRCGAGKSKESARKICSFVNDSRSSSKTSMATHVRRSRMFV